MKGDVAAKEEVMNIVEARAMRKVDRRVLPLILAGYFFAFSDRAAISNLVGQLEESVCLRTEQYSLALVLFTATFVLFEIPSNIMLKLAGPRAWLALLLFACGVLSLAQAFAVHGTHIVVIRALLGVFEAGVFPGFLYYVSCWYKPAEIDIRVSLLLICGAVSAAITSLAASRLPETAAGHVAPGLHGWQYIFVGQGSATALVGMLVLWLLPNTPASAAFLTGDERLVIADRVAFRGRRRPHREEAGKRGSNGTLRRAAAIALTSPITHLLGIAYFAFLFPAVAMTAFSTKTMQSRFLFTKSASNVCFAIQFAALALAQLFGGRLISAGFHGLLSFRGARLGETQSKQMRLRWVLSLAVLDVLLWAAITASEASAGGAVSGRMSRTNWPFVLYLLAGIVSAALVPTFLSWIFECIDTVVASAVTGSVDKDLLVSVKGIASGYILSLGGLANMAVPYTFRDAMCLVTDRPGRDFDDAGAQPLYIYTRWRLLLRADAITLGMALVGLGSFLTAVHLCRVRQRRADASERKTKNEDVTV